MIMLVLANHMSLVCNDIAYTDTFVHNIHYHSLGTLLQPTPEPYGRDSTMQRLVNPCRKLHCIIGVGEIMKYVVVRLCLQIMDLYFL